MVNSLACRPLAETLLPNLCASRCESPTHRCVGLIGVSAICRDPSRPGQPHEPVSRMNRPIGNSLRVDCSLLAQRKLATGASAARGDGDRCQPPPPVADSPVAGFASCENCQPRELPAAGNASRGKCTPLANSCACRPFAEMLRLNLRARYRESPTHRRVGHSRGEMSESHATVGANRRSRW